MLRRGFTLTRDAVPASALVVAAGDRQTSPEAEDLETH
jgi:hypothetical protein